jgi:hypothetical protein
MYIVVLDVYVHSLIHMIEISKIFPNDNMHYVLENLFHPLKPFGIGSIW